jgi:small-conductance mechanosensitive channel
MGATLINRLCNGACAALVALVALSGGITRAADAPAAPDATAGVAKVAKGSATRQARHAKEPKEGTLVVFNRPVFTFRAIFLGATPTQRVDAARERINALLGRGGPGAVTVEPVPQGSMVKVDGSLAFIVTEGDIDPLEEQTTESVARDAAKALEQAIAEMQEARSGERMIRSAIWAGGATLVYFLALWLLSRIARMVTARMVRLADDAAGQIRVGGAELLHRERTIRFVRFLLRVGYWAFVFLLTYQWIGFVLSQFPYTRVWGEELNTFLVDTVTDALSATASAIPGLFIVVAIFLLARGLAGILRRFFERVQSGQIQVGWLDADSARPTRRLVSIAVWVFALVMAYPYIPGSDSDAFKGLSVLIGLMISVGASGIVGQAASGLILMYTRTFRPGEYIRVGEHEGTVVYMGMFTSRVRTGLGEELTLPNSFILAAVTRNYSRTVKGAGFIVDTVVTIGYDAPWRQVHAMLIEAAKRTDGVLADPKPQVFQTSLSDFYVEYRLVCQAVPSEPRPRAMVLSSLHSNVQDVFNEHGVQIMSPHYLGDPAEDKVVPKARWYASPAEPPR